MVEDDILFTKPLAGKGLSQCGRKGPLTLDKMEKRIFSFDLNLGIKGILRASESV